MWIAHPEDWIEIDEDALQAALNVLDYRIDGFGRWYERWNKQPFAGRFDDSDKLWGSPDYFKPVDTLGKVG